MDTTDKNNVSLEYETIDCGIGHIRNLIYNQRLRNWRHRLLLF